MPHPQNVQYQVTYVANQRLFCNHNSIILNLHLIYEKLQQINLRLSITSQPAAHVSQPFQIVRNKLHPKPSHRRNTWGQQGEAHLQGMLQGFHDAFQLDQT